jgi:hypothetical protein
MREPGQRAISLAQREHVASVTLRALLNDPNVT